MANSHEQKTNGGGPAFPCKVKGVTEHKYTVDDPHSLSFGETRTTTTLDDHDHPGMSLRDYFAAHAPAKPQRWFVPVMPDMPQIPEVPEERLEAYYRWIGDGEKNSLLQQAPAWAQELYEKRHAASKAVEGWRREYEKQRYIQWPWAWADHMLAGRDKKNIEAGKTSVRKYRHKHRSESEVIEAFEYVGTFRLPGCDKTGVLFQVPDWVWDALVHGHLKERMSVRTPHGPRWAECRDYIIRDASGALHTCRPEIFHQTFEPVEEPTEKGD